MSQQPISTQPITPSIAPLDPQPIVQSESSTAVILAVTILISTLIGSMTQLVQVVLKAKG